MFSKSITRIGTTVRWSDAVVHAGVVHLVEVPFTLPASLADQTREVFLQIESTLAKAGSAKDRLLMCTIYLAAMTDREEFNTLWDAWLPPGAAPVRACVQAGLADPQYKLEIHVQAAV